MAGDIIPVVGGILKGASSTLEWTNHREIKMKLEKISQLVRDDQKNLIAKFVAAKLLIKRRTYISKLTMEDVHAQVTCLERLQLLFEDSNIYKLMAQIDLKIVEALILAENVKEV